MLAVVLALGVSVASAALAAAGLRGQVVHAQGVADAAATSAAAAAVGLVPGAPCAVAARVTAAVDSVLTGCETRSATVRVRVLVGSGPFAVDADAVAGPADEQPGHCVYGVPVGHRSPMSRATRTRSWPGPTSTIDQGDTCQARRSS
ncbi:hypothetical protein DEI99_011600 [Curtobacterium sp. MCLR17_036]|uniref:hypothetical protein n=1 Tax=Curtobacterium sp. MCLR17_036 TaxID=2175620 RepID=UPI000DAA884E|nr:hypothetical protein [Curtobacterium sp. MCLR17_036]WIE63889.1 hypothetical protein DEI99_011600 [Curtobacterium sp. MCLR17_036]